MRELLESSKADHFQIEAKNYQVAGDKVTFDYSGIGDSLRELGAGAEYGTGEAVMQGGRIKSLIYKADPINTATIDAAIAAAESAQTEEQNKTEIASSVLEFPYGNANEAGEEQASGRYKTPAWFSLPFTFETTKKMSKK